MEGIAMTACPHKPTKGMNMKKLLSPTVRKYIYGVCIAALPVAVYLQLLPLEALPVILPFILAILNVNPEVPADD